MGFPVGGVLQSLGFAECPRTVRQALASETKRESNPTRCRCYLYGSSDFGLDFRPNLQEIT
jgi:hypothetical protein